MEKKQSRWKRVYLHVFWVITNAVNELSWLNFVGANTVDGGEEREFVFHSLCLQHDVDFGGSDRALYVFNNLFE